jgi:hypothetical protein
LLHGCMVLESGSFLVLSNRGLRRCALALVVMLLTPLALSQLL